MQHELDEASGQRAVLLSCRSVEKYFGALAAVQSMNFDVYAGEVVGIGGPNGAGKTTLFDIISGLNPADAGEILLSDQRIEQWKPDRICHAGLARTFQLNAAFEKLSAVENVLIGSYYGRRHRIVPNLRFDRSSKGRALEAIELVGMGDCSDTVAENLSVFDRKRLMIASALATRPKLLLLDEPVSGLNPHEIDEIMSIVNRVRDSGVTIVLIEHVMRFLVALSDRVLIMHHGEKIYEGSTHGLAQDRTVIEVYLGEGASDRLTHMLEGAPSDG